MMRLRRGDRVVLGLVAIVAVLGIGTSAFVSSVWGGPGEGAPPGQVAVASGDGEPVGFITNGDASADPHWMTADGELIVRDRDGERVGTLSCRFVADEHRDEHPCPPATSVAPAPDN